jgi:hypothetical protein
MVAPASNVVLGERSNAACAVASYQGQVRLAWTGTDTRLNLLYSSNGQTFGDKRTLPFRSYVTESQDDGNGGSTRRTVPLAPALARNEAGDHLAWTSYDQRVNYYTPGHQGGGGLGERSDDPPALASRGADLLLAWTGTDRRLNLRHRQDGHWGEKWTLDERSSVAPAVCASAGELALAWTGSDRHLNVLVTQGGAWGVPVRLDETSS